MSKRLRKIKNRLGTTIPANYSLEDSQERNNSSSPNYKLKTLITQKIESSNLNKLNTKTKRVYLNNMNRLTQNQNIKTQSPQKEQVHLQSPDFQLKQRYITRVKSSNGGTLQSSGFFNEKSIRHTHKLNKIMKNINEVQFQSELYWNGSNSYLVTGVKNQYQKIKKAYEEKCIEIQKIKKQYNVDKLKQLKFYIQKLEKENTKLLQTCQKFRNKLHKQKQASEKLANSQIPQLVLQKYKNSHSNEIIESQLNQIHQRYQKLQKKLKNVEQKNSGLNKQNRNLITKVFLQEKLIIQSENREFKLNSLCKKLEKQVLQVKESLRKSQDLYQSLQKNAEKDLIEVKSAIKQEFMHEKKVLLQKLRIKDSMIDKLNKQFLHMKNVLDSWENSGQCTENQTQEEENQPEKQNSSEMNEKVKLKIKNENEKLSQNNLDIQNQNLHPPTQRSLNNGGLIRVKGDSNRTVDKINKNIKRQRVTALTHKQGSVRCRPVEMHDIQRILEYLKLKLAFSRVNPAEIAKFFNHPTQISISFVNENEGKKQGTDDFIQWQIEYITIKEIYDMLLKTPFSITEAQALLLSRFIVQDVNQPYIYMNWDSQNSRRMAKSIISNVLTYDSLSEDTIQKSEQLLKKYETVLMPALKSVTSKNLRISRQKFIQILNGLGLERTKYMDDYIIGKMCYSSQGLDVLDFTSLFRQSTK